jgi:adenylate cyclase
VAERTLNAHFRACLGVSPMRHLQRIRLAAARETLLTGSPDVSVSAVAKNYCFDHLGRFADHYRRCFGELPSATLRNSRSASRTKKPEANRKSSGIILDDERRSTSTSLPSRERPSIVILPCHVSQVEPGLRWIAEGVAEAIAAALCSVRSLTVMAPKSIRAITGDPRRFARELDARYLLTGRIVQADARLRLILCVLESATGHHVWGDCFDGERDRPLELQDRIVTGVMRAVLPNIRAAEIDRARRLPPQNLDAYGLAMRALPLVFASRPDAARRALELLHRAMAIDPDYGLATALAAWGHGQLVMYNGTSEPAEERSLALDLVKRAAILDGDDPLVLTARCAVHMMAKEFEVAEALVARALALDPTSGWAWGRSGWLHSYRGDSETAIKHFGRALSLDPTAGSRANSLAGIGSAHFHEARYEAAALWLKSAILEEPGTSWANRSLSVSYARLGERLKALESLDALRRFCPDVTVGQVVAAVPFGTDFLNRLADGLSTLGLPP